MPFLAAAAPAISAAGGIAGGAAQLAAANKTTPLDSSIHNTRQVQFDAPQQAPIGQGLPTQPLTANLGSSLPSNVNAGSYALPRNQGLYQGAQPFDLLTALQGFGPNAPGKK